MTTKKRTIESGGHGSYHHGFTVYEHSVYPRHSVLAGQHRRVFRDRFATLAEAQAAYPDAVAIPGTSFTPPVLDHLRGELEWRDRDQIKR